MEHIPTFAHPVHSSHSTRPGQTHGQVRFLLVLGGQGCFLGLPLLPMYEIV